MKTPTTKMTRKELVDWVWDNDKVYYFELCMESIEFREAAAHGVLELEEMILDVIRDAVYYHGDYNEFVKWNEYNIGDMAL